MDTLSEPLTTPPPKASHANGGAEPQLVRALGPWMAVAVVIGNTIGSGIYAKPGGIATDAGDFALIISIWIAGGLLCILGALCFAELGAMMPRAGGLYVYIRETYGRLPAFLFGWCEFLFGRPASIGALGVIFAGSAMTAAMGHEPTPLVSAMLASLVIAVIAWVNVMGVLWGGRLNTAVTAVKVLSLAAVAIVPFALVILGRTGVDFANYETTITPAKAAFAERFGVVLLAVLWAYNGWHQVSSVAEEVREPQRVLPLSMFAGLGAIIVLYVAANVAYHGVFSMRQVAETGDHTAELMFQTLLGRTGGVIMSLAVMCSTFGAITSNLLHGPRVSFAMGRDRVFFEILGRCHANYRTPAASILVQALMSIALVLASAVLVEQSSYFRDKSVFNMLTDYVIFSASIFYLLAVLAVIVLRFKRPDWERPYRTWGYPIVPIVFVASYIWFLYRIFIDRPFEACVGLGLIAAGVPFFYAWQRWYGGEKTPEAA